jgi:hypothetical protein
MIHELTLLAVKRKLYDFDHVPRFINACEITCALGIACQEAGLTLPELTEGTDIMDVLAEFTPALLPDDKVEDHVKEALQKYYKTGEMINADAITTMELGYKAKLPSGRNHYN